jgi:hypothetical protein
MIGTRSVVARIRGARDRHTISGRSATIITREAHDQRPRGFAEHVIGTRSVVAADTISGRFLKKSTM